LIVRSFIRIDIKHDIFCIHDIGFCKTALDIEEEKAGDHGWLIILCEHIIYSTSCKKQKKDEM